jgi:alanine racemase
MQNLGPIWIEIDLDAIVSNIKAIRGLLGEKVKIMGTVKANAYGHDASEVAHVLLKNGASCLAVARLDEGVELRRVNIKAPILILGLTPKEQVEALLLHDLTPAVCDIEMVEFLSQLATKMNKVAKVHIKVDTGMGRIGVLPEDTLSFVQRVQAMENIQIEGIFTHFSVADEKDKSYTEEQFEKFTTVLNTLEKKGIKIPLKHVANSATILDLPHMYLDMVRPGIIIYGLYPSAEVKRVIKLKPALKLKTRIVYLKKLPAGRSISYGRTYTTTSETLVATLPVGYADGYSRLLSNNSEVLIRGSKTPVIGRVCMDQTMIDVTHIPGVAIGEEVTLCGNQGIEETAERIETIVNEVVCMVDKRRVPKLFIKDGKPYKIKSMLGERLL